MPNSQNPQDAQVANQPADALSDEQLDSVAGGAVNAPISNQIDFCAPGDTSGIGLLLPAVQAAREAAKRSS